ncbi:MAG: MBL fold metallo-hydrolase [Parcubacteria group bacterium]
MYISWLGHSCFKFEDKVNNNNVVVVTDPYDSKEVGLHLTKTKSDIVTVSHFHPDHCFVEAIGGTEEKKEPMVFDRPGEYETKGVFVNGIGSYHDKKEGAERGKSTMFIFHINGLSILHLGDLGTTLSDVQLEKIGDVDILLIPIGGKYTIDSKEAAEVVKQVEPRIVIPMHYKIDGVTIKDLDTVDKFKKEMGNGGEVLPKLKITKKELLAEETKLVILEKV